MIKIISVRVLLLFLSVVLFASNAYAQNGKIKCPNKRSFWKSNANKKLPTISFPAINMPIVPKIKTPDISKVSWPQLEIGKVRFPEIKLLQMPVVNLDIKKGRQNASTNCPKRVY